MQQRAIHFSYNDSKCVYRKNDLIRSAGKYASEFVWKMEKKKRTKRERERASDRELLCIQAMLS